MQVTSAAVPRAQSEDAPVAGPVTSAPPSTTRCAPPLPSGRVFGSREPGPCAQTATTCSFCRRVLARCAACGRQRRRHRALASLRARGDALRRRLPAQRPARPSAGLQERGGVGARGLGERGPQPAVAAPPGRPAEPGLGGAAHGLAGGVDPAAAGRLGGAGAGLAAARWPAGRGEDQHPWEAPRLTGRGVAWRVPRLRALGNGWVPQTAVLAWRMLTEEP